MSNIKFKEKVNLKSEAASVHLIEPIVMRMNEIIGLQDDKINEIIITCSEAVNNAIQHGNKFDEDKEVRFELIACEKAVEVIVRDEGCGFDPDAVANPLDEENLFKPSGRGIFFIKELSDRTSIISTPEGTTINFVFELKDKCK